MGIFQMSFNYAKVLPCSQLPDIYRPLMRLFNKVLHEVLSQGASEIYVVKLLAIQVYLLK